MKRTEIYHINILRILSNSAVKPLCSDIGICGRAGHARTETLGDIV